MATSGTYSFSMTRDSIIAAALRTMEVIGAGQTPSPDDLLNCAEALNIRIKALGKNLLLWCIQDCQVPMVAGQASYNIGPLTSQPRPLRILQAFIRDSSGKDTELTIVSRYEYNTQGQKTQQSQPNQLYYDPQLNNGIITVYGVPFDATSTIHLIYQRPVQDFNIGADNPDFPQEAFLMLKWSLIDEVALEYGAKPSVIQIASAKANAYTEGFLDFEQDQASVFFTPTGRMS